MDCIQHPETPTQIVCTRCDDPICEACTEERNGRRFCASCATYLDRRLSQRMAGGLPAMPVPPSP